MRSACATARAATTAALRSARAVAAASVSARRASLTARRLASACALSRRAASFSARFAARSAHVDRARSDDAARGTAACLVRGRRARGGACTTLTHVVVGVRLGLLGLASARPVRRSPIAAVQHAGTGKDKCISGRHPGARRGPPALAVCVVRVVVWGGCRAHYRQTPSSSESYHAGDGPSGRHSDASRHSWRSLDLRSLARGRLVSRRPRSGLRWRAAADAHGGVPRGR